MHDQPVEGTESTRGDNGSSATVDEDHSEPPAVSAPVEDASSPSSHTNILRTNGSSSNGSSTRAETIVSDAVQEGHSEPPAVSPSAQEPEEPDKPSVPSLTNGASKGSTSASSDISTVQEDDIEPPAVSSTAQEPDEPDKPSVPSRTDGASKGSTSTSSNGSTVQEDDIEPPAVSAAQEPSVASRTDGASKGSTSTSSKGSKSSTKKTHEWQVLSAERLGLYASPHNKFPTHLPTDETEAIGTVPNYLPPSNESGLLRRIPQSQDELLQEMEELELKNPSASLQVLLPLVAHDQSAELTVECCRTCGCVCHR